MEWQLGYAPGGWEIFRNWGLGKGFTRMEMIEGGLLSAKEGDPTGGYDRFRDRLMFPIRNDYGEVVAFSGRILNDSDREAKYVNSPETPVFSTGRVLFGLDKSKRSLVETGTAIVMEGQIDLISAFEHGVRNVVAPQGTAFTTEQARLLRRFVDRVILCFDSDTAGQNAVEKSLPALLSAGIDVRVSSLPKGFDPDSLIREKGVKAFQDRIAEAKDFFDHSIEQEMDAAGDNFGAREKAHIARKLGAFLTLLPEAVLRETTTSHVASRLGLSVQSLLEAGQKNPITPPDEQGDASIPSAQNLSESTQLICRLALHSEEVRAWLSTITSPAFKELDSARESAFASAFSKEKNHLSSITPSDPLAAARDAIDRFKLQHLKKRELLIKLELNQQGLSLERILAINKEILDLRAKIDELFTPAT